MSATRPFMVHADDHAAAHRVDSTSFEAAALTFIEVWHPAAEAEGDIAVYVTDEASGRRQCFSIDLVQGKASPCD